MGLLTPGHWPATHWPANHWPDEHWPKAGVFYIRRIHIENKKPTYRLETSSNLTTDIILSPSNTLYPSDTLYPNGKKYYTIRISEGS